MKPLKAVDAESAVWETADTWENRLKVREIESSMAEPALFQIWAGEKKMKI